MNSLAKRLTALEAQNSPALGKLDLDRLSDEELERLEQVVIRKEAGERIEIMPDDDLRFLASIRVLEHGELAA